MIEDVTKAYLECQYGNDFGGYFRSRHKET